MVSNSAGIVEGINHEMTVPVAKFDTILQLGYFGCDQFAFDTESHAWCLNYIV